MQLNPTERSCILILRNLTAHKICAIVFALLGFLCLSVGIPVHYSISELWLDQASLVLVPIFNSIGGFCFLMSIGMLVIFEDPYKYQPIV